MMTGYLAAQGVYASEVRVGRTLAQMHEPYHQARCQGARNLNPVPYNAEYVGHKLHMDQNEKLCKGIPTLLARDGCKARISEQLLPSASDAADLYRQEMGHSLTIPSAFGMDPFRCEEDKIRAETEFNSIYCDLVTVLNNTVNEYYRPYQECLVELINITRRCA
ncbi:hypothetical protein QQF64_020108 [Cirrhinus molitorella]|uniref:Uncharacterized protein n=1 Tax=Cirrhinus molitorella TaxID=172907 RepID=A0ABR3LL28_9TELE